MKRYVAALSIALSWCGSLSASPKIGDTAPSFTLVGADGKSYSLADYRKKVVVLEWYNKDCPFVGKFYGKGVMQAWQGEQSAGPDGVVWFTITSSAPGRQGFLTPKEAAKVREDAGMKNKTLLLDSKGTVGRLYGAKTTPNMFVIDRKGKLAYEGAVDDRPSAQPDSLVGAQTYFLEALGAIRQKSTPKTPSTTPYGCAIKYL
jgi:peroxiredoxin